MNYQKYVLAGSPGFVRRQKASVMHWLKIFKKKKKREQGQIKKKESKFVPKPLGVGKKST